MSASKLQSNNLVDNIPANWNTTLLRFLLKEKITDGPHETPEFVDEGYPFLSVDGIQNGELVFEGCRFISEGAHIEYSKKVKPINGDLLMGKAASTGKIAQVKVDFEFSIWSPLAWIRPNEMISSDFLELTLKSDYCQAQIEMLCTNSTQNNISMQDIPRIRIHYPPKHDQDIISSYLVDKISKLNIVEEQLNLELKLLEEKRSTLISQAVTKGLHPDVEMKDSGINWIDTIPQHWQEVQLRWIVRMQSGTNITSLEIEAEGTYPVFGGNGLRGYIENYTHEGDHVLIGRQGALCGCINYAHGKFWPSEHAVVVSPTIEIDYLWLGEMLRSMNLGQYSQSAAQPGLSVDRISSLKIPLPPLEEQRKISLFIKNKTKLFNALKDSISYKKEKIEEFRTALISATVTGQIDVRHLEA